MKSRAEWEPCCAEKDFTGRIFRPGDERGRNAAVPRKRGRKSKPVNPLDHQLRQVQAENRKLKRKLEKFEAMLSKKKSRNISLASSEENGDESSKLCEQSHTGPAQALDLPPSSL